MAENAEQDVSLHGERLFEVTAGYIPSPWSSALQIRRQGSI